MKIGILGICGRIGGKIYDFFKNTDVVVGIDYGKHPEVLTYANLSEVNDIDVLIDFSSPSSKNILKEAIIKKIPVISGTTGYSFEEIEELNKLALSFDTIFYWSANFAKGIKLFEKLINDCNKEFEIFDFVEIHATTKKDSPSGTSKMLAKKLNIDESKIQSLRLNKAPAIHEIVFSSDYERIIIRHEVINYKAFIMGFCEVFNNIMGDVKDVRKDF